MTHEQMQKIVDGAPEDWQWVSISNQGEVVYFKNEVFGLAYYVEKSCWVCANPDVKKYLVSKECIRDQLAKREPMDLRSVDIPHGTIVLEK